MDEPHQKKRRFDEGHPSEVDSSSVEDHIVQSSPLVSAEFPDDLSHKIIGFLANPDTSEHVASFAQTCRRVYSLAKECMEWKRNLPAISIEIKRKNGENIDSPVLRIAVDKTHRMFDSQFDDIREFYGVDWITDADSRSLEFSFVDLQIIRVRPIPLQIKKVIGNTIKELSIEDFFFLNDNLARVVNIINGADVRLLQLRSPVYLSSFESLANFFEQRRGRRVEFHETIMPSYEVHTNEETVDVLRRIFRRVDIVFRCAKFFYILSKHFTTAFYGRSHMEEIFKMIHEESGTVEVNGMPLHPPFDLSHFDEQGVGLVGMRTIRLFAPNRNFQN